MRKEIAEFLDEYILQFKKLDIKNVESIVLFGSQARGTAKVSSDIDIAVVMTESLNSYDRGRVLSIADDVDMRFETNLFFTTRHAVDNACRHLDTNTHIKNEGVVLWQQ